MISVAKFSTKVFLLCIASFVFFSCEKDSEYLYTQLKGQAQGTTFNIVYDDKSETDYSKSIDSLFKLMDKSMSLWDSTSTISNLNKSEKGYEVDMHFQNVYHIANDISKRTYESLDITMGSLIKSWGFIRKNGLPVPSDSEIAQKLKFIGIENFDLQNGHLTKKLPEAEIDMNAVAQGYTVDVIAAFLESKNIENYLIEVGGEIRTKGKNKEKEAWKVGIEKPDFNAGSNTNAIKAVVGLSDRSLATSGSYRKFVEVDGKKYSHTIDPKTGRPVTHNLLSVTVIAQDCASADAFATAFMVLGKDSAMAISKREKLDVYCIYDVDGELKSIFTPGFESLLVQEH